MRFARLWMNMVCRKSTGKEEYEHAGSNSGGFSRVVIAVALGAALFSCQTNNGQRELRMAPPGGFAPTGVRQVVLQAGPEEARVRVENPFKGNAQAIADGRRLYHWYNCAGCHFNGGGGIGPPLMDQEWIYGGEPDQIFSSIVEGRTNGMPAYGGRIPEQQVWQIIAFIEELATEDQSADIAGARADILQEKASEHTK